MPDALPVDCATVFSRRWVPMQHIARWLSFGVTAANVIRWPAICACGGSQANSFGW